MAVYSISYDLKSRNYEPLIEAIKSYGIWWHQSESTWLIETTQTSRQVIDNLRNYLGDNDKLMVIQVLENWWAVGLTDDETHWMKSRIF